MFVFFFHAEDGISSLIRSRGLGYVYERQSPKSSETPLADALRDSTGEPPVGNQSGGPPLGSSCLLETSDAADEILCVELGVGAILN